MFGYVFPCRMELKVKEYEKFKAYYCGLCHAIKNIYGNIPRLSLNYDMTFLGLLLDSMSINNSNAKKIRCFLHPNKEKPIINNSFALDYAANINVILFYNKLLDDIQDDKSFKSKLGALLFFNVNNKFKDSYSEINTKITSNLKDLYEKENNYKNLSLDEIAHPFSDLTGYLFMNYPNPIEDDSQYKRDQLYWLGYNLGKWIYLIDAFDDLEEDMKNNKFNALSSILNNDNLSFEDFRETILKRIEFSLLNCASQCYNHLQNLNISKNKGILDNIIKLGITEKTFKVLYKND
ncbi:DUF5685 family protein [Clostridium fallax]|uniref:Uncharacterized protein n=1 Tax=Clostridium fallax TaxID=1533 RepID=A0A1M4U3R9_9CLOT|nr:DUF5685 family protein [Clostridium fallax]SHE51378.1 hypothetical protein SAMN05443638_10421 [Clostridium fallax]SQB06064.1 Uncharacterised protein [Clostridium fallax]